ncbi:MAG: D-alanyl-D-alanine endopeptidase [Gammaproteobacteria bacterium]
MRRGRRRFLARNGHCTTGLAATFAAVLISIFLGAGTAAEAASSKGLKGPKGPDVRSNAVLVIDGSNSTVVFERKPDLVAPIASITKLMTALVVLDGKQPLDEVIEVTSEDKAHGKGAYSRLNVGTRLTRGDLLRLALMSSENRAAHALGRSYPGGESVFVRTMNAKARALGMTQSHFSDPSGLSTDNVASARDLAKLVIAAGRSETIREYSTSKEHEVRIGRSMVEFHNTNSLVKNPSWTITVQKTGFINEAGQCLVMQTLIEERPVIIVLLNSFGKYTRVADAKRIRQWMESQHSRSLARVATARRS